MSLLDSPRGVSCDQVQAEQDRPPPARRRRRALKPDASGHIELQLTIGRAEAMARLRGAVSVDHWWTIEAFTKQPVIGSFAWGNGFILHKSSNLDTALQELPDLTTEDGGSYNRRRPTLHGQIEDLPEGGSRLTGEFIDGVFTGKPVWIMGALFWLALTGWYVHDFGPSWGVLLLVPFFLVLTPIMDVGFRFMRWLYQPDKEILVRFLDRQYRDVQVSSPERAAPAPRATRRRPRLASSRSGV